MNPTTHNPNIQINSNIDKLSLEEDWVSVKAWMIKMEAYLSILDLWNPGLSCPRSGGKQGLLARHIVLSHLTDSAVVLKLNGTKEVDKIWNIIKRFS